MERDFKIAVVATIYFPASHTDVIVSRWLEPRASDADWGWDGPQSRIASLYVAQFPPNDLSQLSEEEWEQGSFSPSDDLARLMAKRHGIPLCETVRDALTLGTGTLAVDGVLLVGEHGDYPLNELGQKLYPRKELFDGIVAVFQESGRSVPLFCDKHLSWNGAWAQEMVATTRELGIPFLAGSSLPYAGLEPDLEIPAGSDLEEAVALFYCGPEAYGFHSLELVQAVIESRTGGESGIRALCVYEGEAVWEAMERGAWSQELFEAALQVAPSVQEGDMKANCLERTLQRPTPRSRSEFLISPVAFCLEHTDGLRTTHIMLEGHISDFTVAVRVRGDSRVRAGRSRIAYGNASNHYGHFATLDSMIERMFLTGKAPVPPERTLLTTLTVAACMKALSTPGKRIPTPELEIAY